jgi:hypothetical protein
MFDIAQKVHAWPEVFQYEEALEPDQQHLNTVSLVDLAY